MRELLLELLKKDCFISGEQLAANLGVSRTAVWKQIKILQKQGYKIKSVKNKGYKLVSRPDVPFPEEITVGLNTKTIGKKVHYFKSISSTNLFAKQIIDNNAEEGTVIISDVQTSGRGRKNRVWSSPRGGLWFSVVLYPRISPQHAMLVTMTGSVAVAQAIKETTSLKPIIKWPNDLLINGKKVCGILTELDAEIDRINYVVIGFGINVNNSLNNDLKKTATSLTKEIGIHISRVNLLRTILRFLDTYYDKLISGEYDFIRNLWLSHTNIIGRKIQLQDEKTVLNGIVTDVDDCGCLILKTKKGITRVVSGDINYL